MEKKNIYMKIFDKQFKVELISFEDKSTKEKTYRKVIFKADREVYHYIYEGTLSYVVKDTGEEVYSPFKCIENGSYYEEIGRKLSIQQRATDINKVFGKMPQARELLEEKENNLFSGYSEKTKEIFQNHISLESEEGYLLIKAQDVLDAIEEALNIIWYGPDEVPPAGGSKESITVLNQSQEKVMYDFLDASWYSADNPSRESHVEKWRYPAPIKK